MHPVTSAAFGDELQKIANGSTDLAVASALGYLLANSVGAGVGYHTGKQMREAGESRPKIGVGTVLGAALLPGIGSHGYIAGKRFGYSAGKKDSRD